MGLVVAAGCSLVSLVTSHFRQIRAISRYRFQFLAAVERRIRSGATGVFPLRFGREVEAVQTRLRAENAEEARRVHEAARREVRSRFRAANHVVGNHFDGMIDADAFCHVRPHHEFPLFLRDFEDAGVESARERDAVAGFVVVSAELVVWASHPERAFADLAEDEFGRLVFVGPAARGDVGEVGDRIRGRVRAAGKVDDEEARVVRLVDAERVDERSFVVVLAGHADARRADVHVVDVFHVVVRRAEDVRPAVADVNLGRLRRAVPDLVRDDAHHRGFDRLLPHEERRGVRDGGIARRGRDNPDRMLARVRERRRFSRERTVCGKAVEDRRLRAREVRRHRERVRATVVDDVRPLDLEP